MGALSKTQTREEILLDVCGLCWFLSLFHSLLIRQTTLYVCVWGFFRILKEQETSGADTISLPSINQPDPLGRVRVRHQPTDEQFFPLSSTFFFSFLGSFLQQDALADPSFTSPGNGYGCVLKQGGEAGCPWGTGMCSQVTAGVTRAMP